MVEELYTAFYDELLRYCASIARQQAAAEDLVQETYLRALGHLDSLEDLSRSQRRAWLYKTARNLYIDRVRKASRETAVGQLVDRLPESERALFALRYFEGYNATELGDLFDLPPSTVRARLASARKKMMDWYVET